MGFLKGLLIPSYEKHRDKGRKENKWLPEPV
jgi:hypothetical protein